MEHSVSDPEEKLEVLKNKIQKLIAEADVLKAQVKEKDQKLKEQLGINLSKIETILDEYRKMYIDLKSDLDRANSYGGPDPTEGGATAILQSKMNLLKEIILNFESEIQRTLTTHKKGNKHE